MAREKPAEFEVLYRRALPGGGHVIVRASKVRPLLGHTHYSGEVVVERRTESQRRDGHVAPVVARFEGRTMAAVLHELFPVAHSNAALAVACMARRRRHVVAVPDMALAVV